MKQTFLQLSLISRKIASNNVFINTDKNSPCLSTELNKRKTTLRQWLLMIRKCSSIKLPIFKLPWKNSGNKILNQTETRIMFNKIIKMNIATETTKTKEVNCFRNTQKQFLWRTCTKCFQSQVCNKCKDKVLSDTYLEMMRMERRLFQSLPLNSRKSDP